MLKWTKENDSVWRSSDGHLVVREEDDLDAMHERDIWRVILPDGKWMTKAQDRLGRRARLWYRSSEAAREAVEYGPDRKKPKEMRT